MRDDRFPELSLFDECLRSEIGGSALIGTDEAGRGPLAGPVFAAAVCLPQGALLHGVDDSKRLSSSQREEAARLIEDEATCFAVAIATAEEIDALNIRQASLLAMRRACVMLNLDEAFVIVDGKDCLGHNFNSRAVVGGDSRSLSIASASILAKVARDEYMTRLDEELPGYGFAKHKGYPTRQHLEAIKRLGPSAQHRLSFRGVLIDGH